MSGFIKALIGAKLRRAAMKKITKSKGVPLELKAKTIHTLVFSVSTYRCKRCIVKKVDRENKNDSFKIWVVAELYGYHGQPKGKQLDPKAN